MDHVERRGEAWALEFAGWPAREGDELRLAMSLHVEPAILCRLERLADACLRARARRSPLASSASIYHGVLHLPDQNLISGCRPPQRTQTHRRNTLARQPSQEIMLEQKQ